jgi:acyl-coenzyme A synthetase/AMP-(fatty) acid ligase
MLEIFFNFSYLRYNTGDFFSMDKDGKFYFKSRRKELITARGSGTFLFRNVFYSYFKYVLKRSIGYLSR